MRFARELSIPRTMLRTMQHRSRRGFALPMAIFVIAILTVTVAASFLAAGTERRIVDSQEAQARAYNVAQAGLERYLADRSTLPGLGFNGEPTAAELSTSAQDRPWPVAVGTSTATVRIFKVRASSGTPGTAAYIPAMYAVQSEGTDATGRLTGTGSARRTVGQLVQYVQGNLGVLAGWTSLSGLRKAGSSGTLSGTDNCGQAAAVAGIAVPNGGFSGNDAAISGNPAINYLGTQAETNAKVKINWPAIKSQNAIPADFVDTWPTSAQYDVATFWPVIHWTGDRTIDLPKIHANQRGMLIVDGDLTIGGSVTWDGIILVGGNITSNGNNTVYGAVVTGLDEKLGEDVVSSDAGNGTKIYQYDSCNVTQATAAMGTLRPMVNTWTDNWKSY